MNTSASIIRILILISFLTVGFLSLFAIPLDDSITWLLDLLLIKALSFICFWAFARLYGIWKRTDRWVRAFDRWNTIES